MEAKLYTALPPEARQIRQEVFMEEQGFQEEFDEIDQRACHLVLYDGAQAVGTCRFFPGEQEGEYLIGRVAVRSRERGRHLGWKLLQAAERAIREKGGRSVRLHAQVRVKPFYEGVGYTARGEVELDEGCPHIWMEKTLEGEAK